MAQRGKTNHRQAKSVSAQSIPPVVKPRGAALFSGQHFNRSVNDGVDRTTEASHGQVMVDVGATVDHLPALIRAEGPHAGKRYLTFFTDAIRNPHTRRAYHRATIHFFDWCAGKGLDFRSIESFHVSAFIEHLLAAGKSKSSVKQSLAAIRMTYDWLVVGQVVAVNPAHAVRGPKLVIKKGKTPVLSDEQMAHLLSSIPTATAVDLRDRALIATMAYTFGRIGAVTQMNVADYYPGAKRWLVRLHEKGGKYHELPAHHKLEECLDAYISAAGIADAPKTPLFRTAFRRTEMLTENRMTQSDAWRMIRRRARAAGISTPIGCHTFRATGITNYMQNGGTLEHAKQMAAHESSRTTQLYIRTDDVVTLKEVERVRF